MKALFDRLFDRLIKRDIDRTAQRHSGNSWGIRVAEVLAMSIFDPGYNIRDRATTVVPQYYKLGSLQCFRLVPNDPPFTAIILALVATP